VVFVLKPEGVIQRALEVGYRTLAADVCQFKVSTYCASNHMLYQVAIVAPHELRHYISVDCLTVDIGGSIKYNHLEWIQHRMVSEHLTIVGK
jgi:hypothetical protein